MPGNRSTTMCLCKLSASQLLQHLVSWCTVGQDREAGNEYAIPYWSVYQNCSSSNLPAFSSRARKRSKPSSSSDHASDSVTNHLRTPSQMKRGKAQWSTGGSGRGLHGSGVPAAAAGACTAKASQTRAGHARHDVVLLAHDEVHHLAGRVGDLGELERAVRRHKLARVPALQVALDLVLDLLVRVVLQSNNRAWLLAAASKRRSTKQSNTLHSPCTFHSTPARGRTGVWTSERAPTTAIPAWSTALDRGWHRRTGGMGSLQWRGRSPRSVQRRTSSTRTAASSRARSTALQARQRLASASRQSAAGSRRPCPCSHRFCGG